MTACQILATLVVICALFQGTVVGRIREEELTTVTSTSIVVTWVTQLRLDTQITIAQCDAAQSAIQLSRADTWKSNYVNVLSDNSDLFSQLMSLQSQGSSRLGEIQDLMTRNLGWVSTYLLGRQTPLNDEPLVDAPDNDVISELLRTQGRVVADPTPTQFHYISVGDLLPGTTYCYQVSSGSETGSPTQWSPGTFTTLTPPPGEKLFSFATVNDMHVGEAVAGLIVIGGITLTPGFSWDDPENPYWKFTNEAAVQGINGLGVDFTIAKGDVSSDYKQEEYQEAKRILGGLAKPYYVMRGNHDRVESGPDYYRQVFELNNTWYSFDHKGFHFVALDSVKLDDGAPKLSEEQFVFLDKDLASSNSTKTFIFLHHAVTLEAFIWSLPAEDRDRFIGILAKNPQVVGVFSGHSHRASLTTDLTLKELVFAETPSTKEYPMGFSLYEVYTGGYIQTFHRSNCVECLEWNSMTRQEFFRLAPFFQFGSLADKNFVVSF